MIFLFSINIKSFGAITANEPTYNNNNQYEISSKEELYWFAQMINGEETNPEDRTTNAKLTQDITINSEDLITEIKAKDGVDESGSALKWTPIGNNSNRYTGTFDGNGKTISGLYCDVEKTGDEEDAYAGLFGFVQNGVIKDIEVKNSYFKATSSKADAYVGGLIGYFYVNSGGTGEVRSSYSSGCTVIGDSAAVGGLIGMFDVYSGGTGAVTSSYSSGCTVTGTGYEAYVGGLIGFFYVLETGNGNVTGCNSSGCTVTGGSGASVGGLIGSFNVSGTGEVKSSYSSGCTVTGGSSACVGGLIGDFCVNSGGTGEVKSSYSSGCTVIGDSAAVGGLIGYFYVWSGGTGAVKSSYSSGCTVTGGSSACVGGLIGDFYVNSGGTGEVTSCYSTNTNLTATGTNSCKGGICGNLYSGTIKDCYYLKTSDLKGTGNKEDGETRNDVKPFGAELKIPVRVKINYDPSNKLETWIKSNLKHEFFRTIDGKTWKKMLEDKQYFYTVSPVESSIKINPDGSKTQDFIFNYYIYHAQDNSGNDYKFGFNKKYPVNTYIREDVGGGKKLYIDYGVFGRE